MERSDVSGQVSEKSIAVIVPDRSIEALIPLIGRYIELRPRIITDGWAADSVNADLNYTYEVKIHEKKFESHIVGDIHPQNVVAAPIDISVGGSK